MSVDNAILIACRRVVIDGEDRPYLRFSEGVSDWKTGRVIVPHKTRYATLHDGQWQAKPEVSGDWPMAVQHLIDTPGDSVAGVGRPSPWFIFEKRGLSDHGRATYVFLHHLKDGYAARNEGPAWPPAARRRRTTMKLRTAFVLGLVACLLPTARTAKSAERPPNIVLIISDDQGYVDHGFMGNEHVQTPHPDRLAAASARFPNGYVPASVCRPSLATLLTGL